MSEHEHHVRKVRRKRRVRSLPGVDDFRLFKHRLSPERLALLLAGLAVGVVVGIICFSYGSRFFKNWQETRLLKQANILLQQSDYKGAEKKAQRALEVHPDSLSAFYVLAQATEAENRLETVAWRAQIERLAPDRLDSHLNLASAALRFGELETARKALDRIAPADRNKAEYHVVAGWLARVEGDEAGLLEHFAAAAKEQPSNDLYQFNLAALQIKSDETEMRDKARETLLRLSHTTQYRGGALRALLNDAVDRNDLKSADEFAQDLQMTQQVTFNDLLLCLNFYRKLDEKKFSTLLEKVKPVAARNSADLGALMDWMNNNGMSAEILKWMDKLGSDTTTKPPAAAAIAEAFAQAKNWSRLRRWTRSSSWGSSDYLRLAYQAYAARQLRQSGNDAEFDSLWRSAEVAANNDVAREMDLARLAGKWGLVTEGEQLWNRIARNAPARREAYDALAKIYRTNNDLPNLYRTTQRLHEISPGDTAVAANYARLALLLDQNAAEGHRVAKEAYERSPTDVNCAVTYAFSLYGQGRTTEGIEIIHKLPVDQLHDPHAAVYTAVLLMDENQLEPAREYIEAARRGPIFVEERKLLDEAISKSNPAAAKPSPAPAMSPKPATSATPGAKPTATTSSTQPASATPTGSPNS